MTVGVEKYGLNVITFQGYYFNSYMYAHYMPFSVNLTFCQSMSIFG
jgi:hypothetical protein